MSTALRIVNRQAPNARRLRIEALEDRRLLAVLTWTGAADAVHWETPGNWSDQSGHPGVPTSGDSVQILKYNDVVKLSSSATVNELTIAAGTSLDVNGGHLTTHILTVHGFLTAEGPGATFIADGATNADDASLRALGGATLALPNLSSYQETSGDAIWLAEGTGSVLDLSSVTSLNDDLSWHLIQAISGGKVDLRNAATISNAWTQIISNGSGSVIDLSGLTTFFGQTNAYYAYPSFDALNSGLIQLTADTIRITGAFVFLSPTGTIQAGTASNPGTIWLLSRSYLVGQGTLHANLINGGQIDPPWSILFYSPHTITVDGDFTQTPDGILNIVLGGVGQGAFEQLNVTGSTILGGTLNVYIGYDIASADGNSFRIVTAGSLSGVFAAAQGLDLGSNRELAFAPDATGVTLTTSPLLPLKVTAVVPSSWTNSLDHFDVTFNKAITLATLAPGVAITAPDGSNVDVNSAEYLGGSYTYRVHFAPQTASGVYTIAIQPTVADLAGSFTDAFASTVTVDNAAPTSSMEALPACELTTTFTVSWSGADNAGGSGIAFYDVFVSDNGGAFKPWQTGTTGKSALFTGQKFHTYRFYCVATDNAGNRQATPTAAQATTLVNTITSSVAPLPAYEKSRTFTVNWSGSEGGDSSAIKSFTVYVSDNGGAFKAWQTDAKATSAKFTGKDGHAYAFYSVAKDEAGHSQAGPFVAQATTLVDLTRPYSRVAALPTYEKAFRFTVRWAGSDGNSGSGIASYTIYVSDNGGTYAPWLTNVVQTSAVFAGQDSHKYRFLSVATDKAGNVQTRPSAAQATTRLDVVRPTSSVKTLPAVQKSTKFTVNWSGTDGTTGSGIARYSVFVSDNGGDYVPLLVGTTKTSMTFVGVNGHSYGFYCVATDKAGNVQPTPAAAQATTRIAIPGRTIAASPAAVFASVDDWLWADDTSRR